MLALLKNAEQPQEAGFAGGRLRRLRLRLGRFSLHVLEDSLTAALSFPLGWGREPRDSFLMCFAFAFEFKLGIASGWCHSWSTTTVRGDPVSFSISRS